MEASEFIVCHGLGKDMQLRRAANGGDLAKKASGKRPKRATCQRQVTRNKSPVGRNLFRRWDYQNGVSLRLRLNGHISWVAPPRFQSG
jgi:hypothetical protein